MSTCKNPIDTPSIQIFSMTDRANPSEKHKGLSLFLAIKKIGQFLLYLISSEDELRIWQTCDRYGNTWWHGCDRATGRSTCVATDDEMRAWIDRRYCQ
ncbi:MULTISPECIES: hypothetical protein [unclassified Microcoleus]|uniref:hypothetical protein n=1 Tax=unclassified Microcoleus TaxID=2642155 RepID=UPI002FCE9354